MSQPFRIAIAGLGTVGSSLASLLVAKSETLAVRCGRPLQVVAVSARSKAKDRGIDLSGIEWVNDPVALAHSRVDAVVELIGGADGAALELVRESLKAGKSVVTANKALLARHGLELARIAEDSKAALAFEAAAAGAIPVVKTLREALAGNSVSRISGILNGTCNYILTRMEREGLTFAECLKDAQKLGYAEADPTFDVEGYDTAHKLALLASLAFGTVPDAEGIYVEGISSIAPLDLNMAEELGYRIKLLGVAVRIGDAIEQRVHPTMIPKGSSLAQVMNVTNAVSIHADAAQEITLSGPGAGGMATASAVLADILDLASDARRPAFGVPAAQLKPAMRAPMQRHEGGYYIRLSVYDRPGALAGIAARMAQNEISVESVVQKRSESAAQMDPSGRSGAPVPVVLITYATTEQAIRAALAAIHQDGLVTEPPQVIRIERE